MKQAPWSTDHLRKVAASNARVLTPPALLNETGIQAAWFRKQHPTIQPEPLQFDHWPTFNTEHEVWFE